MSVETRPGPGFVHRAVLHADDDEAAVAVADQLRAAVARGEPAFVAVAPGVRHALERVFGDTRSHISFADMDRMHLTSVDAMIDNYLALVDRLPGTGRVHTVVQYDVHHPHDGTADFCLRVEDALNVAAAGRTLTNTCLYDLRQATPGQISDARRTHPILVVDGIEKPNPDFSFPASPTTGHPATAEFDLSSLAALRRWLRTLAHLPADTLEAFVFAVNEAVSLATRTDVARVTLHRRHPTTVCHVSHRRPTTDRRSRHLTPAVPGHHDLDHDLDGLALAARLHPHVTVHVDDASLDMRVEAVAAGERNP